jgi:hypothetical protein
MADVLIRTPQQWEDFVRSKVGNEISHKDEFFVEHQMAAEFSVWAIRRGTLRGLVYGIVGTLFFVVMLGFIVRLMT